MKLLTTPAIETDYTDIITFGGGITRIAGSLSVTDVVIMDSGTDSKNEVWDRLKYGIKPDLLHAMYEREKIPTIAFPENGVILFGVTPYGFEDNLDGDRNYECSIDYFEVIE